MPSVDSSRLYGYVPGIVTFWGVLIMLECADHRWFSRGLSVGNRVIRKIAAVTAIQMVIVLSGAEWCNVDLTSCHHILF